MCPIKISQATLASSPNNILGKKLIIVNNFDIVLDLLQKQSAIYTFRRVILFSARLHFVDTHDSLDPLQPWPMDCESIERHSSINAM